MTMSESLALRSPLARLDLSWQLCPRLIVLNTSRQKTYMHGKAGSEANSKLCKSNLLYSDAKTAY